MRPAPATVRSPAPRRVPWWLPALCLLLTGCGFHLRGAVELPEAMAVTYIQGGDPFAPLVTDLKQLMRASGVEIAEHPDQATAVLRLDESVDRRVLSVGSTGKVREFELHYRVEYAVVDREGRTIRPARSVALTRDFLFDETDVLGKAAEEELVLREMQRDLARLMMLRLEQRDG